MKYISKCFLLALLFVFVFSIQNVHGQFFLFKNPLSGKAAPDFELKTLKGKWISLSDYRDGENAIIFFWASWCPHCRKAISELSSSIDGLESDGIKVLVVDVGENKKQVTAYLNNARISNLEVFLDEEGEASDAYNIMGLPTFVFIGQDGIVKTVQHELPDDLEKIFWKKKQ